MWNQQLFTGGSPAELLGRAVADPDDASVPRWWVDLMGDLAAGAEQEDLRRLVFGVIRKNSKLLCMTAEHEERRVRPLMEQLEAESNGELVGMEFSLKSEESTQRKLIFESSQMPKLTIQECMNTRMTDCLRYTILYSTRNYCRQTEHLLTFLRDLKGFQANAVRNYWETGHAYDGLNCSFLTDEVDDGGILFEVQVHTPESFDVKQNRSHSLYELWRGIDHPMRKYMVYTKMVDLFDSVPRPPGDLMAIGQLSRKTSPEPAGYHDWFAANPKDWKVLNKPEKHWVKYFGVPIDLDQDTTTVITDEVGYSANGTTPPRKGPNGRYTNPMVSSEMSVIGDTGMSAGGPPPPIGCMQKFARIWNSTCCINLPQDWYISSSARPIDTPLVSRMRSTDGGAKPSKQPIMNPMFAAVEKVRVETQVRRAQTILLTPPSLTCTSGSSCLINS